MSEKAHNLVLAAFLVCFTGLAEARVFWRTGGIDDPVPADQLGWNRAYRTTMKVNGAKAYVEILESDRNLFSTRKQLQRHYDDIGANAAFFMGENSGWGLVTHKDVVVRVMFFQLDDRPYPSVFRMRQSRDSFKQSKKKGGLERVTDLPAYPGSRFTHSSEDETTGMSLEVSRAGDTPDEIRSFYKGRMEQAGWKPALPTGGDGNPLGTILFMKGRKVSMISVKPSEKKGDTIITMAVKKQGDGF